MSETPDRNPNVVDENYGQGAGQPMDRALSGAADDESTKSDAETQAESSPTESGAMTDRQADASAATAEPTHGANPVDGQATFSSSETSSAELTADANSVPIPRERFLLLSPTRPLVIELAMTIDGREYKGAMDELVQHALKDADADADGTVRWDELRENRRFRYAYMTEVPVNDGMAWDQMVRQYDANRNGQAELTELSWLLTRGSRSSRPFDLISSNVYRHRNRFDSPLRRLFDTDEDGRLTGQEIAEAPVRLRSRDADVDELLYASDFQPRTETMPNQQLRLRNTGPDTAVMLGPNTRWAMLLYMLREHYAGGQPLEKNRFPVAPALFDQLDSDRDGEIAGEEIATFNEVNAHLVFAVRFGESHDDGGREQLELASMSDDLKSNAAAVTAADRRITLSLPDTTIDFFVNDTARNARGEAQAQMLLGMLDSDNNGYVDKEELTDEAAFPPEDFDEADSDGDGKVYLKELIDHLRRRPSVAQSQIYARASYQPDAFFTALDANHDGRLTSREIDAAPSRLSSWDSDEDGTLSADEVPDSLVVAIVRGSSQRGDNQFQPYSGSGQESDESLPGWFLSMDSNGDGEVSTREFLGDGQQFRQVDANTDGYLDRDEVSQLVSQGPAAEK